METLALMGLSGSTYHDQVANSIGTPADIAVLRGLFVGSAANICPN